MSSKGKKGWAGIFGTFKMAPLKCRNVYQGVKNKAVHTLPSDFGGPTVMRRCWVERKSKALHHSKPWKSDPSAGEIPRYLMNWILSHP